jgi:hypothetical protein
VVNQGPHRREGTGKGGTNGRRLGRKGRGRRNREKERPPTQLYP